MIGVVHDKTRPALKLLEAEGLQYRGYVDIFDGGPTVECELENIRSVKESRLLTIRIGDMPVSESKFIISNTKLAEYRATSAYLSVTEESDEVVISPELADGLMVNEGEPIRILSM